MKKALSKTVSKASQLADSIFTEVSTSTEFDVTEKIKAEVKEAIQATIDSCSKTYYRNIDVDFKISVK